jgi:hypothetical protein
VTGAQNGPAVGPCDADRGADRGAISPQGVSA